MAEFSVFDKLVNRLSSTDRRSMLERIASSVQMADVDLPESETEMTVDVDGAYRQMGLLRRLIVVFVAVFTGRDKLSVVEGQLLNALKRRIASVCADFDGVHEQLRPSAVESIRNLAESARYFGAPLSRVMGRERGPFIAFLAGLHAPDVQHRLLIDADPSSVGEKFPDIKDHEVKRKAVLVMEESLATLPADIRNRIYHDIRALHHLMGLASFPFERLLSEFNPVADGEAVPAPLSRMAGELGKLAGILGGLRPGPSVVFLEALSVYQEQDRLEETDEQVEGMLQRDVNAGNEAYAEIVAFAVRYPVSDLVRVAHGNIHWRSAPLAGGEDWFAVWKSFWKERIEKLHRRFSYKRQLEMMVADAHDTLGMSEVPEFPGYPPSGMDNPAKHGLSLGLLRAIFGGIYPKELQGPLNILYRDGEFYKADNRTEFDDALREIEQVRIEAANLETRLQPTGDLGMLWKRATDEKLTPEAALERQEILGNQIDTDASAVIRRMINAFRSIGSVLQGVLYGKVGGSYDTVSNLGELGAPDANALTRKLESAHVRSKAITDLLSEMVNLESLQQG
ncbi:MAG: DUF5312 family protein [Spirochaetia bacterium]